MMPRPRDFPRCCLHGVGFVRCIGMRHCPPEANIHRGSNCSGGSPGRGDDWMVLR